ncbi:MULTISPECIES: ion channel [Streptomyces]|uniref:ion channel n=1 Tax=Streptomyces TaxID=1883 RepID=UPI002248A096|nr:ion channel [Streptomyces sp. JHD 1]MCX2968090.1 ion channel [Streptomyces sp. JHD 1]
MPILLARFLRLARARLRGWRSALAVVLLVFGTSWLAMWLLEPPSSELADPGNYWWWFLVTASTVGYGDLHPVSVPGRLVGAYVICGGIATLTILFTELASHIETIKGKRMRGAVALDRTGHIVILGYTAGRTERLVRDLLTEDRCDIVVCAWEDVPEHPMPEHDSVAFVRGDLAAVDVLERACVHRAATVVVDARDDNEALTLVVAAAHLAPHTHMVAALRDLNRTQQLRYVSPGIHCVQWHMPSLLTEEALDPGITEVYTELLATTEAGNTYSTPLPARWAGQPFGACQTWFGRECGATVIAVRQHGRVEVAPAWDAPLEAGAVLYYLARRRLGDDVLAGGRADRSEGAVR